VGPCDNTEFASYVELFSKATRVDHWYESDASRLPGQVARRNPTEMPPPRLPIPRVFASPGTREFWRLTGSRKAGDSLLSQPPDIVFIAVIAGNCGTQIMKVLCSSSLQKLGGLVFAEVLNGYSTVFTGACFEGEWARRQRGRVEWVAVRNLQEVEDLRSDNEAAVGAVPRVGIVC
jgi:hypothetical protein